uniref:Transposase n=1 Tax=Heterorhabditis bacteriophora TaxID=37862 RepID=A0A1I7WAS4_HETBA
MLRCKKNDSLNESVADEQIQKLLSDQSRLIATLREEGQILVKLLEYEKKKGKAKIKSLKIEKKDLEDRLEKLLSI